MYQPLRNVAAFLDLRNMNHNVDIDGLPAAIVSDIEKAYKEGLRDGKLESMERILLCHAQEINDLKSSVASLQKMNYALVGAVALMQFTPALRGFLE